MVRILKNNYTTVDALDQFLESSGYEGTINDKMFQYLLDNGQTGALADMLPPFLFADVVPPVITDSVWDGGTSTITVTADEGGTYYWVLTSSATAPTKAEVKLGQDHLGAAADASGSFTVLSGQTVSIADVSGVTPGTYNIHSIIEDAAGNQSDVDTEGSVVVT